MATEAETTTEPVTEGSGTKKLTLTVTNKLHRRLLRAADEHGGSIVEVLRTAVGMYLYFAEMLREHPDLEVRLCYNSERDGSGVDRETEFPLGVVVRT